MILNPQVWKNDLLKELEALTTVLIDSRISVEERDYRVERFLFLSAFIIRKLIEGHRYAGAPLTFSISLERFPPIKPGKDMNFSNFGDLDRFYDISWKYQETMDLEQLCNGFIHSLVFQPMTEDCELHYVMFTSDRLKRKGLYQVEFERLRALIHHVAAS